MWSADLITALAAATREFPSAWDGRSAILEMKENDSKHWRQMEWIGWYFEHLCCTRLAGILEIPGPTYGRAGFDGFRETPWDFKCHASNTSSHRIIVNDLDAIEQACSEFGAVGLILAVGEDVYNDKETRAFQRWHDELKGKESAYVKARKERGSWSRLRKVRMTLEEIHFIRLDADLVRASGRFQEGFRNADGGARRAKLALDLERLDGEIMHTVMFAP